MKAYCFDIDGTLCDNTDGLYEKAEPYYGHIEELNRLYEDGNRIILFTARGSTTGINWKKVTERQLKKWGVKYHKLIFGKPQADIYVDDKGVKSNVFFKK